VLRKLAVATALTLIGLIPSLARATEYVAFGDSVTAGRAETAEGEVFEFDEELRGGYPSRLEELLIEAGNTADTVRNEGIPSEDSLEAVTSIDDILPLGGDIMLLMLGTNDVKRISRMEWAVEDVIFNLGVLRDKASEAGFEETISATIIHRIPNAAIDGGNVITFEIVAAIRLMQGDNALPLVNIWEVFDRIPAEERFDTLYFSQNRDEDPIGHPNAAGFLLIAETFRDYILGVDTLAPILGPFRQPEPGDTEVTADQEIEFVLYDFLSGIDRQVTTFLINGKEVETDVASIGLRRKATLKLELTDFEDCGLRLEVASQDQADPPNQTKARLWDFEVEGRKVKNGDVDFDCRVDGVDLVLFALHFGAEFGDPRYDVALDFKDDGVIDGEDLMFLSDNFGKSSK
jgi:lysophospholipase L1-like esterase